MSKERLGVTEQAVADAIGVNQSAVSRAIKTGRLERLPDGSLDLEDCKRRWTEAKASKPGSAREYREAWQGKLAELEYKQRAGELVPLDEMEDAIFKTARRVRDRLLTIPVRLAPVMASLEHPAEECYRMLEAEVNQALDELAGMDPRTRRREKRRDK